MLTTFGPGSTWPVDSSSVNSAFVSQRRRSTSSCCATGSTPSKPCSDMRLKAAKTSPSDRGRRVAPLASPPSAMRDKLCTTR
jgi:hypothetical protein